MWDGWVGRGVLSAPGWVNGYTGGAVRTPRPTCRTAEGLCGNRRLGRLGDAAEGGLEDFETAFDEGFEADVAFAIRAARR